MNIIWVFSPVTSSESMRRIPPGIYQQVEREGFCCLSPQDVVFSNVAIRWVQIFERAEWITLVDMPMVWVMWRNNVSPPCVAPIVRPGGYSYEVRREGEKNEFFVLTRQEFLFNAAPIAIATPTLARGYRAKHRKDVASPFLPRQLRDVERYFREMWGDRVRRVTLSGDTAIVEWSPLPEASTVIRTELRFVNDTWVVMDAGFCLSGMDRLVPASVLPQLYAADGKPGQVFLVGG